MMYMSETHLDSISATVGNPVRRYSDNLEMHHKKIADEVSSGTGESGLCRTAQDAYEAGEYEKALEAVRSAVRKLEKLEPEIDENTSFYRNVYEEVNNKAYYGRIVEMAEQNGNAPCVLGALKSAQIELKKAAELHEQL